MQKLVAGGLSLVVIIPVLWLAWIYDGRYRKCIRLENGLNLGYEAIFDFKRPFIKPIAVPKFPDGEPLVRDDMWAIYVTDTSIYGWAMGHSPDEDYWYAWRADRGLVLKDDDPSAYKAIVAQAGKANWDIGTGSYGTGWLLYKLMESPRFEAFRCPTRFIAW